MQIQTIRLENKLLLELDGRLDASWSEYVGSAIESAIQSGEHQIDIDLSKVLYISSAGISVLLNYRKRLATVKGQLRICNPVENVLSVLRLMRVDGLLLGESTRTAVVATSPTVNNFEKDGVQFESYSLQVNEPLRCEYFGQPELFGLGKLRDSDGRMIKVEGSRFCVGLGAFEDANSPKQDSADEGRFGESLAVAGVAVEQATDGSRVPDFQISQGDLIPEIQLLYGVQGRGDFSQLIRIEAGRCERGTLRFSEFIEIALNTFQYEAACFTLVVEAAAVVGASLVKSPTLADGFTPWSFPGIRNWLSFTSEQSEDRKLALIVGVAYRSPHDRHKAFLRPIREGSSVHGHFHASVFPYRPLPKGKLQMRETVQDLFKFDSPRSVLHILSDDRPIEGVGETELMRGACWFGPLTENPFYSD